MLELAFESFTSGKDLVVALNDGANYVGASQIELGTKLDGFNVPKHTDLYAQRHKR